MVDVNRRQSHAERITHGRIRSMKSKKQSNGIRSAGDSDAGPVAGADVFAGERDRELGHTGLDSIARKLSEVVSKISEGAKRMFEEIADWIAINCAHLADRDSYRFCVDHSKVPDGHVFRDHGETLFAGVQLNGIDAFSHDRAVAKNDIIVPGATQPSNDLIIQ